MKSTVLYYSKEFNGPWVLDYPQQYRSNRDYRVERRPQLVGDRGEKHRPHLVRSRLELLDFSEIVHEYNRVFIVIN